MRDISLHILDIVENSICAGATKVDISFREDTAEDVFVLAVRDNGRGMDEEILEQVEDPFYTRKKGKRFGLGIPLLAMAARQCDGSFTVQSEPGVGTTVDARFRLSHIDRKPMGDMGATMQTLICGHPDVDYRLSYARDEEGYLLDTADIKEKLGGVPLNVPEVLKLIKDDINEGIRRVSP